MRVTIGQINTTNGDFDDNTARIIRAIEQAKREDSNLVVFPEVCIQGYTSFDWFLDRDLQRCALEPLQKIIDATKGITAIVGTVRRSDLPTGRRLFNCSASAIKPYCPNMTSSTIRVTSNPVRNVTSFPCLNTNSEWQFAKTSGTTRPSGANVCTRTILLTS
jgi:carbon-nitrogen hydrolase